MIKKIIISPPFGNYIERPWATSVKGTFTVARRPGRFRRLILTLRPIRGGWVNKIGLRNPGLRSVKVFNPKHIYSISSVNSSNEWYELYDAIPNGIPVELNVSCPNVDFIHGIPNKIFHLFSTTSPLVILKIPPTHDGLLLTYRAYDNGIRYFHASNTIPSEYGGESGRNLKELNLLLIDELRKQFNDNIKIIAGGGIYTPEDIDMYMDKKADYFSLATIWFTPWKVKYVRDHILSQTKNIT